MRHKLKKKYEIHLRRTKGLGNYDRLTFKTSKKIYSLDPQRCHYPMSCANIQWLEHSMENSGRTRSLFRVRILRFWAAASLCTIPFIFEQATRPLLFCCVRDCMKDRRLAASNLTKLRAKVWGLDSKTTKNDKKDYKKRTSQECPRLS